MTLVVRVRRQDGPDAQPAIETFAVPRDEGLSLWAVLEAIADDVDPTLCLRDNCFAGVCGECGVLVDGVEVLGCRTWVRDLGESVLVEPLRKHPVVRDLLVDRRAHFDKLEETGWQFEPQRDRPELVADHALNDLRAVTTCIHCGLCLSACEAYDDDKNHDFVGPAALAFAFAEWKDPRDGGPREEVMGSPAGVAGCVRCGRCDAVCPADVAPFARFGTLT